MLLNFKHKFNKLGFVIRSVSGRNNLGKLTIFSRGGGLKRFYKYINYNFNIFGIPAKILLIVKDSFCSANISLICFKNGFLMYNLAIFKLKEQDIIISVFKNIKYNIGDRLPLKFIRTGTLINNIEMLPGCGGKLLRAAGSFGKIWRQIKNYTFIKLKSGEERILLNKNLASIGIISNKDHQLIKFYKAGQNRNLGYRPTVRGVVRNPVDHPNGGRTKGGKYFCNKWGHLAIGGRTVKFVNRFIVRRRFHKNKDKNKNAFKMKR